MENTKRTVTCGDLRKADDGKTVVLNGWIHRIREHGGISFINLRDRYGITQVVVDSDSPANLAELAKDLHMEYVVAIEGVVRARPDNMINPDMITGEIEVVAKDIKVLGKSETLPFMIDEVQKDGTPVIPNEDLRLKYRYLDLRREQMKNNIVLRSKVTFATREYLTSKGFLEIETPTFIKSTPEGARDYLVPSRVHPGKFYSLPQSPQLYKQLLMVSGFDKYFQIARCYRDEDARGDRQPEFTQIDMEMSFTNREEVLETTEGMMGYIFEKTLGKKLPAHFDRLAWDDAFDFYGSDKPDLRFDLKMQDADFMAGLSDFAAFKAGASNCGRNIPRHERTALKALVVKNVADQYSRKKIEELEGVAKKYKAKGLAWMKVNAEGNFEGGISKFYSGHEAEICSKLGASKNDLLLFVSDEDWQTACTALGAVRKQLGKDLNLYNPEDEFHFAWIIDFPYFAWNADENHWETEHHMFTLPQEKYWPTLESNPGEVKGDLYDLVLNGYELASGSMRIHDPELQQRIFKIVGYSQERAEKAFGFLVQAFKYGAPPHGGIAPGLDRLVMLMCHEESIHEVIAFPKNNLAASPMDECPSFVDEQMIKDLHIAITEREEE
ncbi:MAG: aspartate--tRNA ligase [Treponemataceae bacterium]|nr:aspartate--tRNA ligase [Spirochaetales bacterium]MDY6031096.1 aspartate--tRNA ligase [Treponemataceae bacterium]